MCEWLGILRPELSTRVSCYRPLSALIMQLMCLKLNYNQEIGSELISKRDGARVKHSTDHAGAPQCQYKVYELSWHNRSGFNVGSTVDGCYQSQTLRLPLALSCDTRKPECN